MKTLTFYLLFAISLNCQSQVISLTEQNKEIYAIIIDNIARPIPPPPPPLEEKPVKPIPQKIIDSIEAIKLNVAIASAFDIQKEVIYKKYIDSSYHKAIENLFHRDTTHIVQEKMLGSKKGHQITVLDYSKIEDKEQFFKDYDQLIFLSNIEFNKFKNKAVVYVGWNRGVKLSGGTILYMLKKEKEKWIIESAKEIWIS